MEKILYVSKQEKIPAIIKEVIKEVGATISLTSFDDLGAALRRQPPPYDLLLIDCGRDIVQVIDVCLKLKSDHKHSHIPLIVFLPHRHASRRIELIQAGADEYVFKPFGAIELEAKIDTFTRIKRTYDELERANQSAKALNERLKELLKLKDDLVSIASHDLKVPITNIGSFTRLLLNERLGPLTSPQQNSLKIIKKNSNAMLDLIDNLLSFFEIQEKVTIRKQTLEVKDILSSIIRRHKSWAIAKEQELLLNIPTESLTLRTDKLRLIQVIENILHNALKYTPRGGRVEVGAYQSPRKACLTIYIKDNGIGINHTHLKSIFQEFVKNHNFGTEGEFGLGLGLAVSKKIIKALDGKITVESEPQKGTTFSLIFRGKKR